MASDNGRRRPCGWGATAGKFLRQSLGRTVFGLESFKFESIPLRNLEWFLCDSRTD